MTTSAILSHTHGSSGWINSTLGYDGITKPRIYLETTIPSYLTAWPSRDLIRAAHQQITREWWQQRRGALPKWLCGSARQAIQKRRPSVWKSFAICQTDEATALAQTLLEQVPLPERATVDALHIAVAAVHGMDYLLTWNCTHIANAAFRGPIESVCQAAGFEPPAICTPEELLSVEDTERG